MAQKDIEISLSMGADAVMDCLRDKPHIADIALHLVLLIEEHGEMDVATAYAAAFTHVVGKRKRRAAQQQRPADQEDGA